VEGLSQYDAAFAEAVFTFIEVCRQRRYAPEPILRADLSTVPGVYTGEVGLGWAFRLQRTEDLLAVGEDGTLHRATRTWRLRRKPSWLQHMAGTSFLVALTEIHIDETPHLHQDIMSSLLQYLKAREEKENTSEAAVAPMSCG
jgi:hypothetical protein